jgi:NADPH:quinone reductase-like Zn-dependent oxidoreductase
VVEAVGIGASLFQPGDEVLGMPHFPSGGAYAEYVTAPSRHSSTSPRASITSTRRRCRSSG